MDADPSADGPLSDDEGRVFVDLLRRYLRHELDQWETVMTESEYGTRYAFFTNKLPDGWSEESFVRF